MSRINSVWNTLSDYKLNSIFFKYFILTFVIIVIPLSAIGGGIYVYAGINAEKQITDAYERSLFKIKDTIDFIIAENNRMAINFSTDSEVKKFLAIERDYKQSYDMMQVVNSIASKTSLLASEHVESVYVYSKRSDLIISSYGEYSGRFEEFSDKSWYKDYIKDSKGIVRWLLFRQADFERRSSTPKNYLTFVRRMPLTGFEELGYIVVNVDVSKFNNFFGDMMAVNNEDVFIINQDNDIVFNGNISIIGSNMDKIPYLKEAEKMNSTSKIISEKNQRKLVSVVNSRSNEYKYATVISLNKALNAYSLRNILIYSVVASILLSIILSLLISIRVYKPFGDIISIINNPEKIRNNGFINGRKGYNELKYILTRIVDINLNRKNMELSLAEYLTMLKKAQMIALQSQINPHFLYNTLSAINWLVIGLTNSENKASEAITNLSDLLRLSLETGDNLIQIEDELIHASKYIEIEKLRFKSLFDVIWETDEEINKFMVVKITLQPLIENAIYHGLKQKKTEGLIYIRNYFEGENIVLEVEDNGVGIESEHVDMINKSMENEYIKEDHNIGLRNVNQRVKLIFGEAYGANIHSDANKGTKVKIVIPKVKNELLKKEIL